MARLPFIVALLNYAFAWPGCVRARCCNRNSDSTLRITFYVFRDCNFLMAYQIHLTSVNGLISVHLCRYTWAVWIFYVILLGLLAVSIPKTRTSKSLIFDFRVTLLEWCKVRKLSINFNVCKINVWYDEVRNWFRLHGILVGEVLTDWISSNPLQSTYWAP